ncbi:MAG: GNAT family N-acetyltransferase [Planctomycetaceae bacterium]|nr:GNAT family N-acetyltransferase [Planctomycetaceae bacterium]
MSTQTIAPQPCRLRVKDSLLKICLGEIVVRRRKLPVLAAEFFPLGCDAAPEPNEPTMPVPEGAGLLLSSYPLARPLKRISVSGQWIRYVARHYRHCYTDLRGTFADYLQANFSSKTRQTLRRKCKKMAQRSGGQLHWKAYATPEDIDEFLTQAGRLAPKTYQQRLLDLGVRTDEAFRARAAELAAKDEVRAFLLFCDDKPIAYLYCPCRDGALQYDSLGYDPAYAEFSPGTVLQYQVMEYLFGQKKYRFFDFEKGEGAHKELFASTSQLCGDIYFLRRRAGNYFTIWLHRATEGATDLVGAVLRPLGLKHRLKRFLRRKLPLAIVHRPLGRGS